MARTILLLLRALALVAALLALTGAAASHAVVVETIPADGALLERAPAQVVVRFNEPVRPIAGRLLDAAGRDLTPPDAVTGEGPTLRIELPPDLAEGSYIASYRVISIDSHPIGGSIVFSIGQASSRVAGPAEAADDGGWQLAMAVVRAAMNAGLLGGAGGLLFLLLVRPAEPVPARSARAIAAVLSLGGAAAALLAVGVQGGLLLGPPASLASLSTWRTGLQAPFGATAAAAAAGLALVAAGLWPRRSALRPLAWLGAAVALASFALSGHVMTAGPRWLTAPLLLAHTIAVAFWVGSLLPLHRIVGELDRAAAGPVARFSQIAVGAVALLVAAGLGIAVLQVGSLAALLAVPYGQILLVKVALVAAMIAVATFNKLRLTPALARGEPGAATTLRRSIETEIGLAAAILLATAELATTPPPRALAEGAESHAGHTADHHDSQTDGMAVTIAGGDGGAEIALASAASGPNEARIRLFDASGAPAEARELTVIAANPAAGVEPIRRAAERTATGDWHVDNLLLVPAGRWTLRLDVLVSDFEKTTLETEVELR